MFGIRDVDHGQAGVARERVQSVSFELNQLGLRQDQLELVRKNGYSVSHSEKLPGARGVAAPVFGPAGIEGCICITSPADRLPAVGGQELVQRVAAEADYLTALYGGVKPSSAGLGALDDRR